MRHHHLRPAQSRRYARRCRPCPPPSRNSWATCFSRIGKLARTNIRSLERALALRRMVIAKMQSPPDESGYATNLRIYEQKGREVEKEAEEARKLISEIIADTNTPSDNITLTRIDGRIDTAINDFRRHLSQETAQLISELETQDF